MEEWQRKYLKTIRCSLEKETFCSDMLLQQLLSDDALADVDLETIRCRLTPSEKAQTLYDIMETRKDGYVAMVKALTECQQFDAHRLLLQGYAYCLSRNTPIHFLAKTKKLSEYFDDGEITEIVEQAKIKLSEKQLNYKSYEYPVSTANVITLVTNVGPPLPSLYIPRKLFKRIVINRKLFQAKSSDTFVFKGFQTLSQLETLVHPQRSLLSGSYLTQDTSTTRFILLENDDHWERILNIVKVPTHRVKYEEETSTCILEMTKGGSKIISQHLERPQTLEDEAAHKFLSEDNFIDGILDGAETSSGVCICDSPGMGKTFLLAKFASKIVERCPNELVAFISLPHFIQHFTSDGIPSQEVNRDYARVAVLEYLSTSPLSFSILDRLLKKINVPVHLLLDGFDEVNFKYIEFTKKLLRELVANLPNSRVIVTSRPNLRYELEAALNVIAFDIAEFTEANQIELLVNYWKVQSDELCSYRLTEFAGYCLQNLGGRLTKEEKAITGIPLLCRLLAQVYARKAKRFGRSALHSLSDAEDACEFETSLPQLYVKYVEGSFDKLRSKSKSIADVKKFHNWIALKTVFPEFESEYRTEFAANINPSIVDSSISMGLLERQLDAKGESVQFIHRTFAEYFVAELIGKTLRDLQEPISCSEEFKNKFARFLFERVLLTKDIGNTDDVEGNVFTNSVIVYFLNYFTEAMCALTTSQCFANQFPVSVSPNRLYSMLFGCLRDNHENVFQFIKSILSSVGTEGLKPFKSEMIPDGDTQLVVWLINVASVSSSITLVDALFAMFRDCFSYDLEAVCKDIPLHLDTPLHFAIERADVEKIQYFAKIMSLRNRKLLLSLVIRSNDDPPQIVKRKVEMCKLLLSIDKDLLSEATYTLYDSVHVEILKVLIEAGADSYETKSEETIIHFGAKHMSSNDFHELCRFLIVDRKAIDLFKSNLQFWSSLLLDNMRQDKLEITEAHLNELYAQLDNCNNRKQISALYRQFVADHGCQDVAKLNEPKWKSPLPYILCRQKPIDAQTIQMILSVPGIDVDDSDEHGNTLFLLAVKHGHAAQLIVVLTQNGANINAINNQSQNALQLATISLNSRIIPFLINLGVDVRHCNTARNCFLHYLNFKGVTAEEYHDIIRMLSSSGKSDIFHLRNKYGILPIHWAVKFSEVKIETLQIFKFHQVDFNSVDIGNNSLLAYAIWGTRSVQLIKALVEMGVDVMAKNKNGKTFAHFLSANYSAAQYHELVSFLIGKGYEDLFAATDKKGKTPLHCAFESKELLPETLELIDAELVKRNKVNINATDHINQSLLMYAAKGRRSPVFLKTLIRMGADVMLQDGHGYTVAHIIPKYYSAEEYHEVIQLLIEIGYRQVFQVKDNKGYTPLDWAVLQLVLLPKTLHLVKMELVQTELVSINSTKSSGFSTLILAVLGHVPTPTRATPIPEMVWTKQDASFLIHRSLGTFGGGGVTEPRSKWSAEGLRILMEMGGDLSVQDEQTGRNFAHWIPYTVSSAKECHDVFQLVVETGNERAFQAVDKSGHIPLHYAMYRFELLDETLNLFNSALFQTGIVDINSCSPDGMSFLVSAAYGQRSVRFLEKLMKMGVATETQDNDGDTFAHSITRFYSPNEYHEIVQMLLDRGQENAFQIVNGKGENPVHHAMFNLELLDETLELFNSALFQTGIVDINSCTTTGASFLVCAIQGRKSVQFLQMLIKMGVDVTLLHNTDGNTFAHFIPEFYTPKEYHDIVQILLGSGRQAAFQVLNNKGQNPLHNALYSLELLDETMDLFNCALFKTGIVDINSCTGSGNSFLAVAVLGNRSVAFLKNLLQLGVDVMIQGEFGDTFAHLIPEFYTPEEYHEIVQILLGSGHETAFQIVNNKGQNPLHKALCNLELLDETMNLFNSALFQTNTVNINCCTTTTGHSFLICAAEGKRSVQILESLLLIGVDIMIQNADGNTFAHFIAAYYTPNEYHSILKMLLRNGQEIAFKIVNKRGQTPLHFAVYTLELLPETVKLLGTVYPSENMLDKSTEVSCLLGINAVDNYGESALHYSLKGKRSLGLVKQLISLGANWSLKNKHNSTLAHISASFGLVEHLKYFVQLGCDIKAIDNDGDDVLQCAVHDASENIVEMVTFLIDKGADIHHKNRQHQTAYDYAVEKGITEDKILSVLNTKVLEILLEIECDLMAQDENGDAFAHHLPKKYSPSQYHEIVKHFILAEKETAFQVRNKEGETPLHMAIGKLELLEATLDIFNSALFKPGIVDINLTDSAGNSFLMHATNGRRSVKFLKKILKLGICPLIQNENGNTFAHWIPYFYTAHEYHEIIQYIIIDGQAKILNIENNHGRSPLSVAVHVLEILPETVNLFASGHLPLEEMDDGWVQGNPQQILNAVDEDKESILHWALTGKRSLPLVKLLISLGADWSVKCNHGSSMIHIAASFGLIEHLKYFVELGCDIHGLKNNGDSVLHCAAGSASENMFEIVTFLLDKGVDKLHKNSKEQTAYVYAIENKKSDQKVLDILK